MNINKINKLIKDKTMDEVLEIRDTYPSSSEEWDYLNMQKALLLEEKKPNTKEMIIYFKEEDLNNTPIGYSLADPLQNISFKISRRSLLEYNPLQRHPIPYIIIKHKKRYFFALRENGSGEERLIGKIGLIGGHVGAEDVDELSLKKTLFNGLKRELQEEVGIMDAMVEGIRLKGIIKLNDGVNKDHLGIVYQIEIITDDLKTKEDGVLRGMWIHQSKIKDFYDRLEPWAKIVYDNVLKNHI